KGLEVSQRGLSTANNNIQMGMSLLGIAEGSIQTMLSPLYRIRDLALQSSNGVYSDTERKAMQMEVDSLFEEITRIKNTTEFNGVNLFGQQIYKDKSETFVDNETAAAISLLSYTPAPMMMSASPANQTTEPEAQSATATNTEGSEETNEISLMSAEVPMMMSMARSGSNVIEGTVTLASGKSKTISIGDKVYTFKDYNSGLTENTCNYSYDTTTGRLTLSNITYMTITAASGQVDNIFVDNAGTRTYIYAGDMNDTIEITGTATGIMAYGESGDDILIDKTTGNRQSYASGGEGNDTIYTTGDNGKAVGGNGNDTFYINGNNNSIFGEAGDDDFIVESGSGNFLIGKEGTNTITDNGTNTGWNDITGVENYNPNSGQVHMASAQVRLEFGGKYYTVNNPSNSLIQYSYDEATDTITFSGSYAQIVADGNQINNIILASGYMTYTGGTGGQDNITSNGSYQTINLGSGTNTVTTNSAYVSIYTNGGNDTINLDSSNNYISVANSGSVDVVVGSGKAYNIINGGNNANLTITNNGTGTGYINCVGYENSLPKQGIIYLQVNEEFDITLMKGTVYEASYTVKNKNSSGVSRLNYSCNTTTGEITFNTNSLPNAVQVTAHSGQNDKIITNGNGLYLYTGDGNDIVTSKSAYNSIVDTGEGDDILNITSAPGTLSIDYPEYYTGAGDDTVTVASGVKNIDIWTGDGADTVEMNGTNNNLYTEAGADTITVNGVNNSIYAGDDNDTVNLNASNDGYVTDLGAGDDIANINANNAGSIAGGDGNDNFIVATGVAGAFVDGNAGTNTLTGDTANTYRYNIEGYENRLPAKGSIAIAGNDEITIEILGQTYRILNRATTSSILKFDYNQTTGLMTFEGASLTIESATGQANNVVINGDYMNFYGAELNDIIVTNGENAQGHGGAGNDTIVMNGENAKAYGYAGDDTITTTGGKSYAYGGGGNDTINTNGAQNYAYGEAGNDTINVNGGNTQAEGGSDNDTIVLNGILGNTSSWVKGGTGNDTITVNSANNTGAIQGDDGDDTINVNADGNTISGGAGSNTLGVGADNITYTSREFNKYVALKNEGEVKYDLSENFNLEIASKIYNIEAGDQGTLNYSYNETTDEITFEGTDLRISSVMGQENNVIIKGDMVRFHGSDANDRITIEGSSAIVTAGDGDDTITIKSEGARVYGDDGNDTFNAYADATIDGGSGNNTMGLTASASVSDYSNINKIKALENSGTVIVAGEGKTETLEIAGKTYTIQNRATTPSRITYNYNSATGEITFDGEGFVIRSATGQSNNVVVNSDYTNFYGAEQNDKIVMNGEYSSADGGAGGDTIAIFGGYSGATGGDGNDNIILEHENAEAHGEGGNDTITINKGHYASGGDGDDTIIANDGSGIFGDNGNDTITINGDNAHVAGGNGDDSITLNGTITDSSYPRVLGESGNDTIIVNSSNNLGEINGGDNDDTIITNGNNNIINSGGGVDTIKIHGNSNLVDSGADSDTILIEGNENDISLGAGNDTATILGDLNTVDGGEDYDIITNGGTNTTISNCNELWKEADPFLFQVGTGVGANSAIEVSTGFVIPIIDLNILDADSARNALEDIDRVIETLTVKLGEIGVSKNRLESALSANEVAEINIAAARSNIVDADIAKESMELLKAQILQNASASLLTASRDINSTSLLNIYNSLGNLRR
ncbi:hypothetical protein IJC60_02835, partial [bacterium]|nr:hypothetical protein [bacterium]